MKEMENVLVWTEKETGQGSYSCRATSFDVMTADGAKALSLNRHAVKRSGGTWCLGKNSCVWHELLRAGLRCP